MDLHNSIIEIHNQPYLWISIIELWTHNWIMEIHNWIMEIYE